MTVGRRLGLAFGAHLLLLAALLLHHVQTLDSTLRAARELSDVSAELILTASREGARLTQLEESVAKFLVTRDEGYRRKFRDAVAAFSDGVTASLTLPLSPAEAQAAAALRDAWHAAYPLVEQFASSRITSTEVLALREQLDDLRMPVEQLGETAGVAMQQRLSDAERSAQRAVRLFWYAVLGAVVSATATGWMLRRSITAPLRQLIAGTQAVAGGEFTYRLDTRRGDEFARVGHAFNTMTERLAALDRLKQDFVSTVSHDLKSPLASLRESTAVLLDGVAGPLTPSQELVLRLQQESGDRLARMIAKLLDLSRLEARLPFEPQAVPLLQLLESVAQHATTAAREHAITVRVERRTGHDTLTVSADPERLRVLIENLTENAVKFSPKHGTVLISAWEENMTCVLEVADRGPGVPAADRERVFERFQQTATGRNVPARGTGLGLTICREIVRAHGGRVRLLPRDGGGCIARVELPMAPLARTHAGRKAGEPAGVAA